MYKHNGSGFGFDFDFRDLPYPVITYLQIYLWKYYYIKKNLLKYIIFSIIKMNVGHSS